MFIKTNHLYTPFALEGTQWIEIEDGKIKSVSNTEPVKANESFDWGERIITPGWIEVQINGAYAEDFTEDPTCLWNVTAKLTQLGITTCLPTIITSPADVTEAALKTWQAGPADDYKGSKVPGLHIEGPFLNPKKKGAHRVDRIIEPDLDWIQSWVPENGVQLVTLAPERAGAEALIAYLVKNDVVVSAGHSMATYEDAKIAFERGVSFGTHLYNAMPPLNHRAPGLAGALLTTDEIPAGMIVDGIHSAPAMVNLAYRAKGERGIVLVTDAMAALGMPVGNYRLGGSDVTVTETDARLADGTLAGSTLTPQQSLINLMNYTGCSFEQALYGLTINPADLMGYTDIGRIAAGMAADLVILDTNKEVKAVMIDGEFVYQTPGTQL